MEAFHTLCTNRRYDTPELTDAEILVMIISALEWKKHNGRIKLLTDNKGYNFIKKLGIEFIWNSCSSSLEAFHNQNLNEDVFWAAPKLYALKIFNAPCVMLDLDFIVWKMIKWDDIDTDLMTIHREDVNNSVYPNQNFFDENMREWYSSLDWNIRACNTSFVFFNDENLLEKYVDEAFYFMRNVKIHDPVADYGGLPYMVFAEQRLLPMIAEKQAARISSFADLDWLFSEQNEIFSHIWGYKKYLKDNQKAHQQFCVDCVERIAYEFPDVYALLKVHSWFARYIAQKIYKGEDL